jgi:hypothetical protein
MPEKQKRRAKIIMHHLKIMKIVSFFAVSPSPLPKPATPTKRQKPAKTIKRECFCFSAGFFLRSLVVDKKTEMLVGFDSEWLRWRKEENGDGEG